MNLRNNMSLLFTELKTRYREYFESTLAATFLKNPTLLPVIKKISNLLYSLMMEHKNVLLKQISSNPLIAEELYHLHYYGRLSVKRKTDPADILNDMLSALNSNADLCQVMQVHAVFAFGLFTHVLNAQDMKDHGANFPHERIKVNKDEKLSTRLGICRNKTFNKLIGRSALEHSCALDKYLPDAKSNFFKEISKLNISFVAGPSGHTNKLMCSAIALGINDKEELMQYALACFAFLTSGGNHSFYEVMVVANKIAGVPFEFNNYNLSFSDSFKQSSDFGRLCQQFPEYIDNADVKDIKLGPKT